MLPILEQYDLAAKPAFESMHHLDWLNKTMIVVSQLGDWRVLISLAIVAAVVAVLLAQRRTGALLLVALGMAIGTHQAVSRWVARPRPEVAHPLVLRDDRSGGFPSGHAMLSMTVYGCLAIFLGRRQASRNTKELIALAAGLLILLVGFAQIYLCTNFATDILAGWCAGLAIVMLFLWAERLAAPVVPTETRLGRPRLAAARRGLPVAVAPPVPPRSIRGDGSIGPPSRFIPKDS
jgi:membrane-associated phospholipid phosphatase